MPKATVSRAIARLEADLGQQLFYRTTRRVTLTRADAPSTSVSPHKSERSATAEDGPTNNVIGPLAAFLARNTQ